MFSSDEVNNKSTYKSAAKYALFSLVGSIFFFVLFSMSRSNGSGNTLPIESSSGNLVLSKISV